MSATDKSPYTPQSPEISVAGRPDRRSKAAGSTWLDDSDARKDFKAWPLQDNGYAAVKAESPPPRAHESQSYDELAALGQQHPPHGPRGQHQRQHVFRFWTWEIASLLIALGLIGAIIGILSHFNGLKVPEWPFSITLNTLISLLATIFRASMMVAVASIIGQAKWSWFADRPQPLKHLHDFDYGSRTALGSVRLVWVVLTGGGTAAGGIAVAAALVTVLSFATGPFMQQAIKTVPCTQMVETINSSLPVASRMPGTSGYYRIGAGLWEMDVDMKGAMISAVTNPRGNDSAVAFVCPTGNCTFPDYGTGVTHASIGLCSKCADTSSFVSGPNKGGNLTMPDGIVINFGSDQPWLSVQETNLSFAAGALDAEFASIARNAMFNFTVLTLTVAPCKNDTSGQLVCPHNTTTKMSYAGAADYVATSCALYPCLRSYAATVRSGVLDERLVSTTPATPYAGDSVGSPQYGVNYNWTALRLPCVLDGGRVYTADNISTAARAPGRNFTTVTVPPGGGGKNTSVPDECLYKVEGVYARAMYLFLGRTLFSGSCDYNTRQGDDLDCGQAWWLSLFYQRRNATLDTTRRAVDDFATAVSNKFRASGHGPYAAREADPAAVRALGDVRQTTVCTALDLRWLVLPGALAIATAALLACMVGRGLAHPEPLVWKNSVLPLLFYGLRGPGHGQALERPALDLFQIEDEASRTFARLQGGQAPAFVDASTAVLVPAPGRRDRDIDMDSLLDGR